MVSLKSKRFLAVLAVLLVFVTQCWFLYPVVRHPKLHYWTFLNFWSESSEHTPRTFCACFHQAVKQVDAELVRDSNFFIDLCGLSQKLMGKRSFGAFWRLKNGYLAMKTPDFPSMERAESDILELNDFLREQHIPLLYIQTPREIHPDEVELPDGARDYANQSIDSFLEFLHQNQINYTDCREIFRDDPKRHYDLFFKSDHHWLPEYAFYSLRKTADVLKSQYGFEIDSSFLDPYNYKRREAPLLCGIYVGQGNNSERKQTGRFFSQTDHYQLFEPTFQTKQEFDVPTLNIHKTGNWTETWGLSGVYGLQTMKNLQIPEKKIFLIKDSYGIPFFDYLSLICHELIAVDPRNNHESLKKQILENRPDIVIVLFSDPDTISLTLE
ncbi:MAG: hypothetical protein IJU53_01940 [Thermoguttaceae bacterium]|nr:hypothetical protein [Thermoguttaceae bacterium]